MYKLLAVDMDGTLLNRQKAVTLPVKEAIAKLVKMGVYVTIASGRFPASVWLHGRYLGLNFPLIALNGAVIVDPVTGAEQETRKLDRGSCVRLADYIEEKNAYVHFYGYNVLYVEEINDINRKWPLANVVVDPDKELTEENYRGQVNLIRLDPVGRLSRFVRGSEEPVYKATVIHEDPRMVDELYAEVSKWNEFSVSRTGKRRFDVNAAGVTKLSALRFLCEKFRIPRGQVVTIGDYDNDLDMLEWAGLGIAMGNSNERAKRAAKAVTLSNDEHGVAVAIKEHFKI